MRRAAEASISILEPDGDNSILRMFQYLDNQLTAAGNDTLYNMLRCCGNHQNALITGSICKQWFEGLIAAMWHCHRLQRQGNYYLRESLAIEDVHDELSVRIRREPPSPPVACTFCWQSNFQFLET